MSLADPEALKRVIMPLLAEARTARALAEKLELAHGGRPCRPVIYKWLAALRARGVKVKFRKVREGRSGPSAKAFYIEATA